MNMPDFHIRVAGDDLTFSAGHFITLENGECEHLHGHTYRVVVEVFGPLNDCQCVVDFIAVRNALKTILAELDHRVLLPTQHPAIHVSSRAAGDCPDFRVNENGTVPFDVGTAPVDTKTKTGPAAEFEAAFADRRWVFPQGDCLLLPMANTTTESLAQYVGERLSAALESLGTASPNRLRIEIGEGTGCAAICDLRG